MTLLTRRAATGCRETGAARRPCRGTVPLLPADAGLESLCLLSSPSRTPTLLRVCHELRT